MVAWLFVRLHRRTSEWRKASPSLMMGWQGVRKRIAKAQPIRVLITSPQGSGSPMVSKRKSSKRQGILFVVVGELVWRISFGWDCHASAQKIFQEMFCCLSECWEKPSGARAWIWNWLRRFKKRLRSLEFLRMSKIGKARNSALHQFQCSQDEISRRWSVT